MLLWTVSRSACTLTFSLTTIVVIKSGGYKISALDIEREILSLDYVDEVMVVGLEDEEYGQRVAAAITLRDTVSPEIAS